MRVLFDGLGEVREPNRRRLVVDRVVELFCARRKAGNKFVLTSRIVGYRDVRPTTEGLGECTLVDFEDDEIAAFIEKWTAALERAARGDSEFSRGKAEGERQELMQAVTHNPGVRQHAAAPLEPCPGPRSCDPDASEDPSNQPVRFVSWLLQAAAVGMV